MGTNGFCFVWHLRVDAKCIQMINEECCSCWKKIKKYHENIYWETWNGNSYPRCVISGWGSSILPVKSNFMRASVFPGSAVQQGHFTCKNFWVTWRFQKSNPTTNSLCELPLSCPGLWKSAAVWWGWSCWTWWVTGVDSFGINTISGFSGSKTPKCSGYGFWWDPQELPWWYTQ